MNDKEPLSLETIDYYLGYLIGMAPDDKKWEIKDLLLKSYRELIQKKTQDKK